MLSIVIADDHPVLRVGVTRLLDEKLDAIVKQVGTLAELQAALAVKPPEVLILDLTLSGGSTLEVISELRLLNPSLPILVLSVQPERHAGVDAILAGASGYLSKNSAPEELVEAVGDLAKGGRYISAELGRALAEHLVQSRPGTNPHQKLSAREHTVLIKISEGLTTSEIARQLELSPKTIGTYRGRILEKMAISTTAGLTRYVMLHDLR